MYKFTVGEKMPKDFIQASNLQDGIDLVGLIVSSPMFLSLSLNKMTEKEFDFLSNGDIKISLCVVDTIPFLVFNFIKGKEDISFASAITSKLEDKNCNALNIFVIEAQGIILKNMRIIGICKDLIFELQNYLDKLDFSDREKLNVKAYNNLMKYTDEELLKFKVKDFYSPKY